jgi:hypothetical protein
MSVRAAVSVRSVASQLAGRNMHAECCRGAQPSGDSKSTHGPCKPSARRQATQGRRPVAPPVRAGHCLSSRRSSPRATRAKKQAKAAEPSYLAEKWKHLPAWRQRVNKAKFSAYFHTQARPRPATAMHVRRFGHQTALPDVPVQSHRGQVSLCCNTSSAAGQVRTPCLKAGRTPCADARALPERS